MRPKSLGGKLVNNCISGGKSNKYMLATEKLKTIALMEEITNMSAGENRKQMNHLMIGNSSKSGENHK